MQKIDIPFSTNVRGRKVRTNRFPDGIYVSEKFPPYLRVGFFDSDISEEQMNDLFDLVAEENPGWGILPVVYIHDEGLASVAYQVARERNWDIAGIGVEGLDKPRFELPFPSQVAINPSDQLEQAWKASLDALVIKEDTPLTDYLAENVTPVYQP